MLLDEVPKSKIRRVMCGGGNGGGGGGNGGGDGGDGGGGGGGGESGVSGGMRSAVVCKLCFG